MNVALAGEKATLRNKNEIKIKSLEFFAKYLDAGLNGNMEQSSYFFYHNSAVSNPWLYISLIFLSFNS